MEERQTSLALDLGFSPEPVVVPEMRDEMAQAWGLPLGERVEVCFRGSDRAAATGVLEVVSTPDYPWNPHQPLQLRIAGFLFGSRDIERWTRI